MDGADATTALLGAWASIRGYFTPAMLFLVVNLVIGTIALSSRSHQRRRRVYHQDDTHQDQEPPDEFVDNFTPQQQELHYQEEYVPPLAPAPLARTPSVLDRLRSFGLYRFRSGDLAPECAAAAAPTPAPDATTAAVDKKKQAAHYDRSRSEPMREQNKKEKRQAAAEARITKSSSEARKTPAAPSIVEEEGVDVRADNFINKFRQQLQLQRLDSLLNYKEMLNRGGKQ